MKNSALISARTKSIKARRKLADQGTRIFAPKPLRSPSYRNHAEADATLQTLIHRYWDSGLIRLPEDFAEAVAKLVPDCELPESVAFNRHRIGGADAYFISNQKAEAREVTATFRVAGKQPELWNPLTGETRDAANWKVISVATAAVELLRQLGQDSL